MRYWENKDAQDWALATINRAGAYGRGVDTAVLDVADAVYALLAVVDEAESPDPDDA